MYMMNFNAPITEIIKQRFSCRVYNPDPISSEKRAQLQAFIETLPPGPFGSRPRLALLASTDNDRRSLRGLGTYGFIKKPPAFIVGAMSPSEYDLEDFGYLMETAILYATSIGLGTCWLGGTFTKSGFAKKMSLSANKSIPAVTSVGEFVSPDQRHKGIASRKAGSHRRITWENLFFNNELDIPLDQNDSGEYAEVLEMLRDSPSASNKQPWRIMKHGKFWRFYLRRTPGYREGFIKRALDLCDLQRLDMGIAMCHFELTAKDLGLKGKWTVEEGADEQSDELTEYIVSWDSKMGSA